MLRFLSWNVNGVRSALKKDLATIIKSNEYDAIMMQEIKADVMPQLLGSKYYSYMFPAQKKGYSGVMSLVKQKPINYIKGIGIEEFDNEGRVQALEYDKYFLVNVYFPSSRRDLSRLDYKVRFNDALLPFLKQLREKKPVVLTGDFNVAHTEDDIARPKENDGNAGFTKQEREWFDNLLKSGYVDTFRLFKQGNGHYSWWLWAFDVRERNIGWRIDYFVVSKELEKNVKGAEILKEVNGSDHAPVVVELAI